MTMKPLFNGPPSPEEFQRQLSEFVRQHFQQARPTTAQTESSSAPSAPEPKSKTEQFEFNYKPREVKAHLDRFVIKQDEPKKVLSVALCDHYHHVRLALEGKESPNYAKQNIILIGPTGVGKTFLIRNAADLTCPYLLALRICDLPFADPKIELSEFWRKARRRRRRRRH